MFDWLRFLRTYNIPYSEKGPNLSKGDVGLRCPFCGDDDPSMHMGIALNGDGYSCWRNKKVHSGKRPHRLIMALLHCSYDEACRIVGTEIEAPLEPDESFGDSVGKLLGTEVLEKPRAIPLKWPVEIRPLMNKGLGQWFIKYLERRRYTPDEALLLSEMYGLRYAVDGPFRNRLVIPVYDQIGLANWTGRSIKSHVEVRYRTLSTDAKKAADDRLPVARLSIDRLLWNLGPLMKVLNGDTLIVCEGPLDALRVDWLGQGLGARATCLFGKNLSEAQALLLEDLAPLFKRRFLMLDPDAAFDMIGMWDRLSSLGFKTLSLPGYVEDPAELNLFELKTVLRHAPR